ncbi:unnamed protein product [Symbiodinium natans]|uniref:USP domain-containing protein n=1 Tax=Symbiodinium natans TaxID=878477 RepID=A0A812J2X4_9DINO|nr:unnamed protein product [Symbiodinium natans]
MALQTTIRLMSHHMLPKRSTNAQLDRHKLDQDVRSGAAGAKTLQLELAKALNELQDPTPASINSTLLQTCQNHYPVERKPTPASNPIVQHLWQKRREAEYAADNGDQRTVYQVVRRLAPWQPRRRVMIKDPQGRLLTLQQEHEALVSYSEDLFAPDTDQPDRTEQGLQLVFTVQEIESQLKSIKIGKAVPPNVAPASVWRLAATQVAELLKLAFEHSHQPGITLPIQWTDAWIVWLRTLVPQTNMTHALATSLRGLGADENMTAAIISLLDTSRQATTFADDTLVQWLIETSEDIAQLSSFINKLLGVMHDLGLLVNITKTACAASSATFGLLAFAPSAKAVALLRGWFYRQLRAVADSPAHITHESNQHLRQRLGVQDPVDATVQPLRHKLEKLRVAEPSIINQQQTIQYWEGMLQQYLIFHTDNTEVEPSSRLLSVPAQQTQPVACTVCGVYFPSTKAMNHVLNNVCAWQQRPGPTRDAETQVTVYQPDRHARSCTVIFQVALATAWHKVGAPETAPTTRDVRTCITAEFLARQLDPATYQQDTRDADDNEVIDMLTRHCGLCLQTLTNQQDWRRHCAHQHQESWKQALQEVANMWGQHSPMELIMRERPTEEETEGRKFRRREGKGPGKSKREPMAAPNHTNQQLARQVQVLTKYVSQHAMALQLLEADRSWVLWMDSGALGIIPQLVKTTATWKESREQNKCNCSLRQALLGALLLELQARLARMEEDKAAQAPLIQRKLLTAEPMAWTYTRWNPDKKIQEPKEGNVLSHQDAKEAIHLLKREVLKPNVTQRFHALGGVKKDRPGTTTFVLTVSLDADARPNINKALLALTDSAATSLRGARIRPERSHKPLPEDLQRAIDEKEDTAVTSTLPIRLCVLENPSNLCYLNSTVQALLHLFDQVKAADRAGFGSLRPMLNALKKCAKPQQLSRRNDCMKLLQGWHDLHQQHDAAELLQHLTKDGVPRILAGRWESRVSGIREHEPAIIRAWNTAVPLIPLPCSGYATTQLALDSWMTQPGPRNEAYVTALAAAPAILSVQLLRFQEKGGRIKKVRSPVTINPVIQVPTFTADHTQQLTMSEYRLISGIVHTGDTPNTGHYRCFFLKPQSHSSEVETIAEALEVGAATSALQLVDDGRTPVNTTARDVQHINRNWYILFFSRQ